MALTSLLSLASCKKDPPPPPPDPDAWKIEAAKLTPFLPPVLGPCMSTATAKTAGGPHAKGGTEYEASRPYECSGRVMQLAIHGGNISSYPSESGGQGNFGSDSTTKYKDVMLGGGRGILMMDPGKSELILVLGTRFAVTASLIDPAPPDEVIPIVNKLDFTGLAKIIPAQLP
ncbi:MAG: hypothetical protein ABI183_23145 [Polyangiaceae bacterium]